MVRPVHRLFLVLVLFFAQLAAGAHAVEHAGNRDDGLPTHTCELCLAGHSLGAALPSVAVLPLLSLAPSVPEAPPLAGRTCLPPPAARQGAPPHA